MGDIKALDIANFLGKELIGANIGIRNVSALKHIKEYSLSFLNKINIDENINIPVLYIIPLGKSISNGSKASYIKVKNPRLEFSKIVNNFFINRITKIIDPSAKIGKNVYFGKNVSIGKNSVIDDNVIIGDNTIIKNNVTILHGVEIGKNCLIRSGVVLGEDGFGFEYDENGVPIHFPHIGNIKIGNGVEIGANSVIARGSLDDTIIENNVKIDALVHVAHNCIIKENSFIIASSQISGSVVIGKNSWIAPSSTIIQKRVIGDNVKIGIGAVVLNNVANNKTVMGLDAIDAIDVFRFKKKYKYGKK